MSQPAAHQDSAPPYVASRYAVLGALWFFQLVNYLDRTAMAFAGPAVMKALAIGPEQFGIILSSFAIGYVIAQLPGGVLSDRWGARAVLMTAPLFWALFTGLLGAASTVLGFVIVRVCFGAAEGVSNGACFKVIGDLFHANDRARASALWFTSYAIGPAVAGPIIGLCLATAGWRATFVLLAVPALLAAAINARIMPRHQPRIEDTSPEPGSAKERTPLVAILRMPSLWVLAVTFFAYNFGYWGFLGWMPTYLASAHHLNLKAMGLLGGLPYVCGVAGLLIMGWLGGGVWARRKAHVVAVCFVLAAAALFIAFAANTLVMTMLGLSGAGFFIYGGLSLMSTVMLEVAPPHARATFMSAISTAGHLGSIIAPAAIGYLVGSSGSFAGGFALMIAGLFVSGVCMLVMASSTRDAVGHHRERQPT
ncbi:MFS transporter [Novosphingobium sp. SG707]|uniref:MFS transporter n=1 Tax=Novosphingobium sp. SG707 TaxID=2586996 RepID=UPI001444C8CC|nr:MFS transporter [Novosphingobium sp. SG707]NKJ00970.1 sugar phosphate permease [Novosphingobium sp. SG707]